MGLLDYPDSTGVFPSPLSSSKAHSFTVKGYRTSFESWGCFNCSQKDQDGWNWYVWWRHLRLPTLGSYVSVLFLWRTSDTRYTVMMTTCDIHTRCHGTSGKADPDTVHTQTVDVPRCSRIIHHKTDEAKRAELREPRLTHDRAVT